MTSRTAALLLAIAGLALSGCGTSTEGSAAPAEQAVDSPSASPSEPAPASSSTPQKSATTVPAILDFAANTVAGASFEGASLAGKPAVLWFWAPWCPTCRGQIEGVSALAKEYGDSVNFVGVGSLDQASAIEDFAGDVPADIPHLLDPEGAVWRHFGIVEQSTYVVLDADAKVLSTGYLDDDALANLVAGLAA